MALEIVWTKDAKVVGREQYEASVDGAKLHAKGMIDELAADRWELRSQGHLVWAHTGQRKNRRLSWVEAPQIPQIFNAQPVDRRS